MNLACLTNIIGITQESCPCLINGLSQQEITNLGTSTSGLYTDDLEGGIQLKSLGQVDLCKSFYTLAMQAKDNAITRASNDILLMLNQKFGKNKEVFRGQIGSRAFSSVIPLSQRWCGVKLSPQELSDGIITISQVQLAFNISAVVNVKVMRSMVGSDIAEEVTNFNVTTVANNFSAAVNLASPIILPLRIENYAYDYYLIYDKTLTPTASPLNNLCSCNCNNVEKVLKSFVSVSGIQSATNLTGMLTAQLSSYNHGFLITAEIRCNSMNFICREYSDSDAVSITIAHAVLYKTGEFIIEEVMKSSDINRITLMNREYLWGKRNHFRAEYESRIKYLGVDGVVDISLTDCFICKDNNEIINHGILA